ncbi:class I SAM-dependent methyltransferase [Fibrella aquatica]|uniref:class I SAM-dependent methyltransferase n=1 Tax=Fibrella aquatica TaxID=3242487 RepID=UPI003522855E
MSSNFEYINCPVCSLNKTEKLYPITYFNDDILPKIDVNHVPEVSYVYRCLNCDHKYVNPQLSDSALDKYYTQVNTEYYGDQLDTVDKLLPQHKLVVSLIEKKIISGRILEIGCGNGFLLSLFDKERWHVIGVEPFSPAVKFAKNNLKLNVVEGYLDRQTFPSDSKFDVILLFDVIEHLKQAGDMIDLINYYLKPGGLLVIGTGDISSLHAKLSGRYWFYMTLREHLSFFSQNSIRYLLKEFDPVEITSVSYMGTGLQNLVTFLKSHLIRKSYNIFQSSHYWLTKFKVTRFSHVRMESAFDHMIVIAKKCQKTL